MSQLKRPAFEKSCFLNIKAMVLKTVLFYSQYVKLGLVIYPALKAVCPLDELKKIDKELIKNSIECSTTLR